MFSCPYVDGTDTEKMETDSGLKESTQSFLISNEVTLTRPKWPLLVNIDLYYKYDVSFFGRQVIS